MIWASTLQIQKNVYFGDLDFIILFVGILPLYAINLDAVSLFADSLYYVFSDINHVIVSDVFYQFE
ncbi:transmembrane protein, putative [Medicago truncatula]|uniref:Transmembrane protein, putative n=1 Tax=Medicago truncatula TaxID=3880 RepID=G7KIX2_MEDTR|nr:transmembrane protein, putative [Medicago truncatula]